MKKDVGIVMPVYNQEPEYLKKALLSILEQTYKNFQFVIVIDGADQQTRKVIKEEINTDLRVKIIDKETNQGICSALNTGFEYLFMQNDIKYLTWVSSDNIYYPNFIGTLREQLMRSPDSIGLVYSSFRHISPEGKSKQTKQDLEKFRLFQNKSKGELLDICFIGVSFMYKKEYAQQLKGYHFVPVEDYEYWLRLTEICDIAYVPEELMDYRESATTSISYTLHTDPIKHRWWRDRFNLARQEARNRRNIPLEVTLFLPVIKESDNTIKILERLLDQTYHCYQLFILDETKNMKSELSDLGIKDPRIIIISTDDYQTKIKEEMEKINTPFVLIYREDPLPFFDSFLHKLVNTLKDVEHSKEVNTVSSYYLNTSRVRTRVNKQISEWNFNELYQTQALKTLSNSPPLESKFPTTLVHSVPKSGTHLLANIISNLPGAPKVEEERCWINLNNYKELNQRKNEILMSHLPRTPEIEGVLNESRVKHIFISRDPRDIVVSLYYYIMNIDHFNPLYNYLRELKTKSDQINAIITGVKLSEEDERKYNTSRSYNLFEEFSPIYNWRNTKNALIIQYEELIEEETRDKVLSQVLEYYEPYLKHTMQLNNEEAIAKLKNGFSKDIWIFRKGTTGQWRTEFDIENKNTFKNVAGQLLIDLGYEKGINW